MAVDVHFALFVTSYIVLSTVQHRRCAISITYHRDRARICIHAHSAAMTTIQTVDQVTRPWKTDVELSFLPFLQAAYPGFGIPSKVNQPICEAYRRGACPLGSSCPERHYTPPNERSGIAHLICKHYQRGLCKKGDHCDFAHTFDLRGERECKEFSRFGICPQGDECTYLHLGPTSPLRLPACPHYARGFCPLGPYCSQRHVKRTKICPYYIAGFCPDGRNGPPGKDGIIECDAGPHVKWVDDGALPKPEVRTIKPPEVLQKEQDEREEEFYQEEERRRERAERGEGTLGRGWGRRRRGGPRYGGWNNRG